MSTDTLVNEAPMVDVLADFDLDDVVCCKVHPLFQDDPCGKEAEWLLLRVCCDAPHTPACDDCKLLVCALGAVCIRCGDRTYPHEVRSRKI